MSPSNAVTSNAAFPCICHNEHSSKGFDDPLEEDEGLKIMHIVLVDEQLNEFQAHDECQDDTGDRYNDVLGQAPDHVENIAVPSLRGLAYSRCNIRNTCIDAVKESGQIADDPADQEPFEPLCDFVPYEVQGHPS